MVTEYGYEALPSRTLINEQKIKIKINVKQGAEAMLHCYAP